MKALERGGLRSVAGIHLADVPALNYVRHLFQERELRSVTANTRADARAAVVDAALWAARVSVWLPEDFSSERSLLPRFAERSVYIFSGT